MDNNPSNEVIKEAAAKLGLSVTALRARLKNGMSVERATSQPKRKYIRKRNLGQTLKPVPSKPSRGFLSTFFGGLFK